MTILVVDDFAVNRRLADAVLSHAGFSVREAGDGVEALRVLEREPIDAVLSDILMPNMDGYRLCLEVRRSEKFHAMPFIFYTSTHTSPGDEALAFEIGADKFLRRPAPGGAIVEAIREFTGPGRRLRPALAPRTDFDLTSEYMRRLVAKLESKNEELRRSEELFAAFMNNLPTFVWMKDLEGRMVYVNKMLEELPEYRGGWRGKTDADLWPAEIAREYRANDRKVVESGQAIQAVEAYVAKGEKRYVLVSKFPILSESGEVVMVGGASVDITERIRAEEALRDSEERFRQLAENIREVFWIENVNPWRLEFVSAAYEKIWKRSRERLYRDPKAWMDAVHPEDREEVWREEQQAQITGEHDHTFRILWPDGAIRWIRARAFPVRDAQGHLVRIAGIAEDITERTLAEQQLERLVMMRQMLANRLFEVQEEERRHLARELHDEIGQSLTAAKLEIEAAKKLNDPGERAVRLDDGLAVIEQLIQSVRTLSLDLRPPLLDEVGLAAALRAHVQSQAARGGLALRLAVDESLPRCGPAIEIACFRVAQEALTNILRHARAKNVAIELRRAGNELRLLIRDDGAGFDATAANTRAASGHSFGLLSMRERVNLAGGRFACKSAAGQGTEIDVHFSLESLRAEDRDEQGARNFGG